MAKPTLQIALVLAVVLLLSSFVSAAVEAEAEDLTIDISYNNLQDDDDKVNVSHTVTIKNTGDSTENVSISLQGLASGYSLSVSPLTLELSAQGSSDVTITGTVPADVDAGVHTIGTLKVETTSGTTSYDLKTDVQQMLEVRKITFFVNGVSEKKVDEDGEELDELAPGDEVELQFDLRNLLDEDYDEGDLDGTITVELDDSDFGDDIDLEEDFELKAGETLDSVALLFTIPGDADEGEYTLEITVESEDGTGAAYSTQWDVTLMVEREEDDLRIESVAFSPAELSCSRTTMLTIEVKNYGTNTQKHAALSIFNTELGIDDNVEFEIQRGTAKDNTYTYQYLIKLKEGQKTGKYPLSINALYEYNTFSDKELVDIIVKDCKPEVVEEVVQEEEQDTTETAAPQEQPSTAPSTGKDLITSSTVVKTVEDPYTVDDFAFAAIMVTMVALIVMIAVLLAALVRK